MVMHSRLSGQRGFMTAESLTSLFFYIVMVAAIAGVGAMVMTKTSGAKGAAALSIARANVVGMINLMDAGTAAAMPVPQATHMIAQPAAGTTGTIPGVGTMSFVAMTDATLLGNVAINVTGITSPDVCRALASVGFGTWTGMTGQAAALSAGATVPAGVSPAISSGGTITSGVFPTSNKAQVEAFCSNIGNVAAGATLTFLTK